MKIIGTGSALPKKVLTNDMLSGIVETSDEWIRTRTGIRERRVLSDETLTDLALEAAQKSIESAGVNASDIDYIMCHNVCNDAMTPSLAAMINKELGANCPTVDLNAACTGFIYALDMADSLMKTGKARNILIVCAEQPSHFVDWTQRETCVLFGDAVGAVVVTQSDDDCFFKMSTQYTDALYCSDTWHDTPFQKCKKENNFLYMRGRDVFRMAVTNCCKDIKYVFEKSGISSSEVSYFLLHQANLRILEAVRHEMNVAEDKFPMNLDRYGNTSSASIPLLMDELNKAGKLHRGDLLVLSAFGAGFTSGAGVIKW
ncbi:MAG: ketoacyl-ACP synthase III [Paludibacteraceae bacterium]|nr:ketoacyl-ACP synthase III [Paludibacteraceae bacterium]